MNRAVFVGAIVVVLAFGGMLVWTLMPTVPPDILLITIDTLRADVLEPYGATDTRTPQIARLAAQGVVYDSATTPIPLTRPAHASILTGLYPDQHGVLKNRQILPDTVETLAEILSDIGYQTAGFTGIRFLNNRSGLEQGFGHFEAPRDKKDKPRAKKVVSRAVRWLKEADRESPVLMWVHVYDPHQPYDPPMNFREGIDPELAERVPNIVWRVLNREARTNNDDVPPDILHLALSYYRREVEFTDFWIGRLLEAFDRLRESRPSMVIFTADHGECFENGNYFEHADCLYEGSLRVPLIVRFPKSAGAGLRVGRRVSIHDIPSTVLRELSISDRDATAGIPLQTDFSSNEARHVLIRVPELANPDRVPFRLRVIKSVAGDPVAPATDPRTRGVVDLEWKFLWTPDLQQLFKLPDERSNRAAARSDVRARMLEALKAETVKFPPIGTAKEDMDPETLEALEALGYVQ